MNCHTSHTCRTSCEDLGARRIALHAQDSQHERVTLATLGRRPVVLERPRQHLSVVEHLQVSRRGDTRQSNDTLCSCEAYGMRPKQIDGVWAQ
jgi:hypothetical protein